MRNAYDYAGIRRSRTPRFRFLLPPLLGWLSSVGGTRLLVQLPFR